MNNEPEVKDFCCIHGFTDKVLDNFLDHVNDDTYSVDIIANGYLIQDLIRILMSIKTDDDEFMFDFGMVDFNSIEYSGEYVLTINNDFELWCEPAYRDNEYSTGYIYMDSDKTYIQDEVNEDVMDKIDSEDVVIFGFTGENKFDD